MIKSVALDLLVLKPQVACGLRNFLLYEFKCALRERLYSRLDLGEARGVVNRYEQFGSSDALVFLRSFHTFTTHF